MKRVLFVDDDVLVLETLRDCMRPNRAAWDMTFVANGEEALAELHRRPVDVIVSDLSMPGLDGGALLRRVRDLAPETMRILVSGHSREEIAADAVAAAHVVLGKPCRASALAAVVDDA